MSSIPALVTRDEVTPLPGGYELPGALDLDVSAISAVFDGAAAAASFYACASVYSQSGHLIGRYFPSQVLAVGDSGEVSLGPFLEQGGGGGVAPAASAPYILLYRSAADPSQTVTSGGQIEARWYHCRTNDQTQSVFRAVEADNGGPDSGATPWSTFGVAVSIRAVGAYLAVVGVNWAISSPEPWHMRLGTDDFTTNSPPYGQDVEHFSPGADNPGALASLPIPFVVGSDPLAEGYYIQLNVSQSSGANKNWDGEAGFAIYQLGTGNESADFTPS